MVTRRRILRSAAVAAVSLAVVALSSAAARAADQRADQPADRPLEVVASFSILGDMAARVGGERVRVTTLVGPDGDAHVFEPRPADARTIASAKVVVINGLGLEEGWMPRLLKSAGYVGPVVVASRGIQSLQMVEEDEGNHARKSGASRSALVDDPHAWQNLANGKIYVENIMAGLAAADPAGAATYQANGRAYIAEIAALDAEVRARLAAIPPARRKIVTTHDAFQYFGRAYGLDLLAPEGVSTQAEPSAADVARLIRQIRRDKITAVFLENMSDNRLLTRIADETGARIGGTVYADALSPADGPAPTYLAMVRHNLEEFARALAGS
jgi:zinc/manganese transport system substrate-binding protein